MRYGLRWLVLLLIFGPPLLAGVYQFETDTWPLFLAFGVIAYIAFCLVAGFVLGWLLETIARVFLNMVRGGYRSASSSLRRTKTACPTQGRIVVSEHRYRQFGRARR